MLFVFRVAIPATHFDVVTDSLKNVVVVEVAKLDAVRLVLHCDLAAGDVDCAVLRVETFCSELVHCVVCVLCVGREWLSPSLDSYPTASAPDVNPLMEVFLIRVSDHCVLVDSC